MYPNADAGSLANYFLASRQLEHDNAELIDELREIVRLLIEHPMWNADRPPEFAMIRVSTDLYERARAALEVTDE